ncbi:hypothetical protein HAZT_HAZT008647 [Hyalella azteca]|uniref:Poly [ADP-ribose] polymerase n=1 Tax=Hyalella azteca TaxID=294128 RepID=A0A6A0GW90_HYAAZ|nr:hypothetical protein HAZT_HAZT008647 [Hyalella azteca]
MLGSWWVFRSWGRIGTSVGGTKLEDMSDLFEAISHFKELFEEKTGNNFTSNTYTKVPGRWTVLDVEFDTDEVAQPLTVSAADSKLPLPVQELVKLIFDIDCMKSQMKEFEIDLKKLPLGKLSERQLLAAYSVLTEAQQVLSEDSKHNGTKILDCSNRFYTLIPHDFGMNKAPLLDNFDIIKSKVDMVESLREIQTAYCLLKSKGDARNDGASLIEQHYEKLNTKLEVVDEKSEEFEVLQQYDDFHECAIVPPQIFRVERQGEAKRFKPFKKLHNHKLLWHGSRLTNFAGILSQGLRIAPPEAPSTGYMFGKGIYFADMVSKSANYCATSNINPTGLLLLCDVALGNMEKKKSAEYGLRIAPPEAPSTGYMFGKGIYFADMVSKSANYCATSNINPTGLLLLCDVALGNMEKKKSAEYVTKLPGGKHSTMGCGSTFPDPDGSRTLHGIEVPCATPKHDRGISSSLLYNEYIVYDVAQVQVKYLVRMKFLYN